MFRLVGVMVTLVLIGFLYITFTRSANNAISSNAAMQEQNKTLQDATGIDPNDKKALEAHTMQQAREIQEYQNQLNQPLPSGE